MPDGRRELPPPYREGRIRGHDHPDHAIHESNHTYWTERLNASLPPLPPDLTEPLVSTGEKRSKDAKVEATKAKHLPWYRQWLYESLACSCAALAILAIVGVLRGYDHQELPSWPHYIGLNTVVALFATFWKSMMFVVVGQGLSQLKWLWYSDRQELIYLDRFEAASRGVLGSFKLLWFLRFKNFAVFGALLMIFLVTFDPFAQQTIQYYSCQRDFSQASQNATVPRATSYGVDAQGNDISMRLESELNGVIISSLENPNLSQGPRAYCPTGNCTFVEPVTTIAVCSKCTNIVYKLDVHCQVPPPENAIYYNPRKHCVAKLPNGPKLAAALEYDTTHTLMQIEDIGNGLTHPIFRVAQAQMIALTRQNCSRQWIDGGKRIPETDCFSRVDYPLSQHQQDLWEKGDFFNIMAVECLLEFCVKSFRSRVVNGVLEERQISQETLAGHYLNKSHSSTKNPADVEILYPRALIPVPCYVNGEEYTFHESSDSAPSDSDSAELNIDGINKTVPNACTYRVSANQLSIMTSFLFDALSGHMQSSSANPNYTNIAPVDTSPPWLETLYNRGDASLHSVSSMFAAVAEAMTTQIRHKSGREALALGIIHTTETCMRVSWAWLALPITITFAGSIFLALTIWKNSHGHRNGGIWKDSLLPLMFGVLDVDEDQERKVGHGSRDVVYDIEAMKEKAKNKNYKIAYKAAR